MSNGFMVFFQGSKKAVYQGCSTSFSNFVVKCVEERYNVLLYPIIIKYHMYYTL